MVIIKTNPSTGKESVQRVEVEESIGFNGLTKALLMSNHNRLLYGEIRKISTLFGLTLVMLNPDMPCLCK